MDSMVGFSKSVRGHNVVWVIIDLLTKSAHFLSVKMIFSIDQLAKLYIREIVSVPISIVYDRDPRFTSKFWKSLQKAMKTKLNFSTAYHPQSDGQSKRAI